VGRKKKPTVLTGVGGETKVALSGGGGEQKRKSFHKNKEKPYLITKEPRFAK